MSWVCRVSESVPLRERQGIVIGTKNSGSDGMSIHIRGALMGRRTNLIGILMKEVGGQSCEKCQELCEGDEVYPIGAKKRIF